MNNKKPWRGDRNTEALTENVEILTGQRGDGRFAAVTVTDMVRLKLAKPVSAGTGGYSLVPGLMPDMPLPAASADTQRPQRPEKPSGLTAQGAFSAILLDWEHASYRGHSYTEIWRNESDNLADAVLAGSSPGQVYSDPVNPGFSGYYWIRHVNSDDVRGPYNALEGTAASATDTDAFFDKVETQIQRSTLISHINTMGSKAFLDMWQQKTSTAGITAGIGIVAGAAADGAPVSQVAVSASQFFVYDPHSPENKAYPFIVDGGRVLINQLVAEDAIIKTIKSQRIVADEVRAGISISTPVLRSATIENGNFSVDDTGNMHARDAQLDNALLNNLIARGVQAYNITANGFIANTGELNNVWIKQNCRVDGTVYAKNIEGDLVNVYMLSFTSTYIKPEDFDRILCIFGAEKNRYSSSTYGHPFTKIEKIYAWLNGKQVDSKRGLIVSKIPANKPVTVSVYLKVNEVGAARNAGEFPAILAKA